MVFTNGLTLYLAVTVVCLAISMLDRPLLYPENWKDNQTTSENDQQAIESGLYLIQLFSTNHPVREQASLLPLEQVITTTPSNSLFNILQGVVIKYESTKPALRIRKNFLITEDFQF